MGLLWNLKCLHSHLNLRILPSTSVPFTLTTEPVYTTRNGLQCSECKDYVRVSADGRSGEERTKIRRQQNPLPLLIISLLRIILLVLADWPMTDDSKRTGGNRDYCMFQECFKSVHCKKRLAIFLSPQLGCHWPNYPCPGIIKLFPVRKSFVSDILAGDVEIANLFLLCRTPSIILTWWWSLFE